MADKTLDITTAAQLLGCSERHARRMCLQGALLGAQLIDGQWRIPVTADARLWSTSSAAWDLGQFAAVPAANRQEAQRRLGMIEQCDKFVGPYVNNGGTRSDALAIFAEMQGVGKRTLQRWITRHRGEGIMGLVDGRGGGANESISDEAWEQFKSLYLTQQRLSVKLCWQMVNYINTDETRGWTIPSLRWMQVQAQQRIPLPVKVLHREGMAAYDARCSPYIQRDPDSVEPGQVWVGDHHQCNCWVRHRGKWLRPWITAWQDMRSRMLVGWHISAGPNQTTIMIAMKRAIEKWGPPDSVKIDNGRDYDSEMWTGTTKAKRKALPAGYIDREMIAGLYAMMNISVSFAIPYHPQSKPIERVFDTLDQQLCKTMPTYCGKDVNRRPEDLGDYLKSDKALTEAMDLEGFTRLVGDYITKVYNQAGHTGVGMEGRSPTTVMATRQTRRVLTDGVLDLLMRVWSGEVKVGKNGVRFKDMHYGQYNADLLRLQGKAVRLAYDPDDLRTVHVYDAATMALVCIAEQNQMIAYGDAVSEDALREAMKQKGKAKKAARTFLDTRLTEHMDLPSLAIMAQQAACADPATATPAAAATLHPVGTPFDTQIPAHGRVQQQRRAKKAAGAEGMQFDVDKLQPRATEPKNKWL